MITYHPWYHKFAPDVVNRCLSEAANVGAAYVRTDIRWSDLLPDGVSVDREACAWYREYFKAMMLSHGLQPMAVLSDPPSHIALLDDDQKLGAWQRYVDLVATQIGDICTTYQILNESNNPVYRIFSSGQLPRAISSASNLIKARNPGATITVNFLVGLPGWQRCVGEIVARSEGIDVVGLDYFPGTWTISFWSDRHQMETFLRYIDSLPTDIKINPRRIAIFETGYSSNVPFVRSEHRQAEYFGMLQDVFGEYSKRHVGHLICFLGIYELCDASTERVLDPEAHFGILRSGSLERKPAFRSVRQLFTNL